jgi:hypothetical protein
VHGEILLQFVALRQPEECFRHSCAIGARLSRSRELCSQILLCCSTKNSLKKMKFTASLIAVSIATASAFVPNALLARVRCVL